MQYVLHCLGTSGGGAPAQYAVCIALPWYFRWWSTSPVCSMYCIALVLQVVEHQPSMQYVLHCLGTSGGGAPAQYAVCIALPWYFRWWSTSPVCSMYCIALVLQVVEHQPSMQYVLHCLGTSGGGAPAQYAVCIALPWYFRWWSTSPVCSMYCIALVLQVVEHQPSMQYVLHCLGTSGGGAPAQYAVCIALPWYFRWWSTSPVCSMYCIALVLQVVEHQPSMQYVLHCLGTSGGGAPAQYAVCIALPWYFRWWSTSPVCSMYCIALVLQVVEHQPSMQYVLHCLGTSGGGAPAQYAVCIALPWYFRWWSTSPVCSMYCIALVLQVVEHQPSMQYVLHCLGTSGGGAPAQYAACIALPWYFRWRSTSPVCSMYCIALVLQVVEHQPSMQYVLHCLGTSGGGAPAQYAACIALPWYFRWRSTSPVCSMYCIALVLQVVEHQPSMQYVLHCHGTSGGGAPAQYAVCIALPWYFRWRSTSPVCSMYCIALVLQVVEHQPSIQYVFHCLGTSGGGAPAQYAVCIALPWYFRWWSTSPVCSMYCIALVLQVVEHQPSMQYVLHCLGISGGGAPAQYAVCCWFESHLSNSFLINQDCSGQLPLFNYFVLKSKNCTELTP